MRKVLVSLMVLSLVPALAGAAVTNPEGFEGYALTTAWDPTVIGEGWIRFGELGEPAEGNSVEIQDGSLAGNTTQVLKIDSSANGENLQAHWFQSTADAVAGAVTTTSLEFSATEILFGSEYRMNMSRNSGVYWAYTWNITIGYGSWWGGGPGVPIADFRTYDYDEDSYSGDEPPEKFWTEPILGAFDPDNLGPDSFEPGNEVWYVLEVEEDNGAYDYDAWVADPVNNHGSSSRARIYDKTTSPGAEEGWTSWLIHDAGDNYGTNYEGSTYGNGRVAVFANGVAELDNFNMTEEDIGGGCNPGDANMDNLVSADDYASVQGAFGNTGAIGIPGDANCDGLVSADDYASVQGNFGTTYGGAPIPEPATIGLLAMGMIAIIRKRK